MAATRWAKSACAVIALAATAAALSACGGGQPRAETTTAPPPSFDQQLAVFERSQFRARYDVETSTHGSKASQDAKGTWHVTWYRGGPAHQRFDVSGKDFDGQQWDLMIFVRDSDLIVCGTNPDEGGKGGCGLDPETALTFLDSLGFRSILKPWSADTLRDVVAGDGQSETVSGRPAWCYSTRDATVIPAIQGDPAESVDLCFAPTGALMQRTTHSSTFNTTFTVTGDISAPTERDFELPYELAPTPGTTPQP